MHTAPGVTEQHNGPVRLLNNDYDTKPVLTDILINQAGNITWLVRDNKRRYDSERMNARWDSREDVLYCVMYVSLSSVLQLLTRLPEPHRQYQHHNALPFTAYIAQMSIKVKVVDFYSASKQSVSKALRHSTYCQEITQFYLHTLRFIRKQNEP